MMSPSNPLLISENISVTAPQGGLLQPTSFQMQVGEKLALLGPNGSGKTTLIRCLLGLQKHQGQIRWHADARLGYLPQVDRVEKSLPLTSDLFLRIYANRVEQIQSYKKWSHELGYDSLLGKPMSQLSRGEFQKILILRALARVPNVLILDEPFSCLDQTSIQVLSEKLLQQKDFSVILSVHNTQWAQQYNFKTMHLHSAHQSHLDLDHV